MSTTSDFLGGLSTAAGFSNADGSTNYANILNTGKSLFGGTTATKGGSGTAAPTVTNPTFNLTLPDINADSNATIQRAGTTLGVNFSNTTDTPKNNTLLYVGIGVAVLVVGVILYLTLKRK